jgi:hypothetical protein
VIACHLIFVGWPTNRSQKPEASITSVTAISAASARASLPARRPRLRAGQTAWPDWPMSFDVGGDGRGQARRRRAQR